MESAASFWFRRLEKTRSLESWPQLSSGPGSGCIPAPLSSYLRCADAALHTQALRRSCSRAFRRSCSHALMLSGSQALRLSGAHALGLSGAHALMLSCSQALRRSGSQALMLSGFQALMLRSQPRDLVGISPTSTGLVAGLSFSGIPYDVETHEDAQLQFPP
ncbi:hypothetical protein E2P81_ATG09241 [Venturia nashicola]|nr:hypothetical protein E2P81_ATG09241 [Venturia nashicola]